MESILAFDFSVLDFIQENVRSAFLDFIMPLISLLGEGGIFYICISVGLIIFKRTRKTGLMLALSLVIGFFVCNVILKPLVARPRPFTLRDIQLIASPPQDFSFPSGHTVVAFESAMVFLMRNKKAGEAFLILAFLISFSRMYMYFHFPTDIIGGIVVGVLSGLVSVSLVNLIYNNKNI